jgi:hypothetical protein
MIRMKMQLVARKRAGRRQTTVTSKLIVRGQGLAARFIRRLRSPRAMRRLRWLT